MSPTLRPMSTIPGSPEPDYVLIAVMGATGSGKSSFINKVSNSELETGHGLWSCTGSVGFSKPFELFGRRIVLIDTPGFDDIIVPDTDILKTIALYLSTTYANGYKLSGVIYLHRISDFRVGGTTRRNFNMFKSLCGEDALKNVVIATNMWGEVTPERGAARERELATNELLFQPVLDKGAKMLRYENSKASAESILHRIVFNQPLPIRIQEELVDEKKDIMDTSAGKELTCMLDAARERYRNELSDIQKEVAEALEAQDMRAKAELEAAYAELMEKMERNRADRDRLSREYEEDMKRAGEELDMFRILEQGAFEGRTEQSLDAPVEWMNRASEVGREGTMPQNEQWQGARTHGRDAFLAFMRQIHEFLRLEWLAARVNIARNSLGRSL